MCRDVKTKNIKFNGFKIKPFLFENLLSIVCFLESSITFFI